MLSIWLQILLSVTWSIQEISARNRHEMRSFPVGFSFGVGSSAYQNEGAWNIDGKSESIWDTYVHQIPSPVADNSTGDVATNSYHLYKRDVEMLRELGADHYRFSLSWPRILPTSFPDKINEAGVAYYSNLIDELLKYNITPVVVLYHWDLPQKLQDMGGWTNPDIVDWFGDYVRVAFKLFGDKVKYWVTFNEPTLICYFGYGSFVMAPALNISGVAEYKCAKNVLMAHARAFHIYDKQFRSKQNGNIFITISMDWFIPESEEHVEATEDYIQFIMGQYGHPIFSKTGDFPLRMKKRVAEKSFAQGFTRSRLPEFSPEEIEYIRGTSDFFGLNHYSTGIVFRNESLQGIFTVPSTEDDVNVGIYYLDEWNIGGNYLTKSVPWGFHALLLRIKEEYNDPPIFIVENGYSTYGGIEDDDRITYIREYLDALLDAIEDGCDIRGYSTWTLMDNFQWIWGYSMKMGLYEVDFKSPQLTRTPRKSAFVYKEILRTRALNMSYEPDTRVMTIDEGR